MFLDLIVSAFFSGVVIDSVLVKCVRVVSVKSTSSTRPLEKHLDSSMLCINASLRQHTV